MTIGQLWRLSQPFFESGRDGPARSRLVVFASATKLAAGELSFPAEILVRRRFAERKTAKKLAVLSLFSAVPRADRIAPHARTVLGTSAVRNGRLANPAEMPDPETNPGSEPAAQST
jgi:hypothetical protein